MAAVALLLVGLTINYFSHYASLLTANADDPQMSAAAEGGPRHRQNCDRFQRRTTRTSSHSSIRW